jgi:hypothetical protein
MIYSKDDDIPESWDFIIDIFLDLVRKSTNEPDIYDVNFRLHRGLLKCEYNGGSKVIDAYALMAREISSNICKECGQTTSERVFGVPLCSDC